MRGKILLYIIIIVLLCMSVLSHLYYGWQSYLVKKSLQNEYVLTHTSEEYGLYLMNFYHTLDNNIDERIDKLPSHINQFVIYQDLYTLDPAQFGTVIDLSDEHFSSVFIPWLIVDKVVEQSISLEDTMWYLPTDGGYPHVSDNDHNMSGLFTIEQLFYLSIREDVTALNMLSRYLSENGYIQNDYYMSQACVLSPEIYVQWIDQLKSKKDNHPLYIPLLDYYQKLFDNGVFLQDLDTMIYVQPFIYEAFQGIIVTSFNNKKDDITDNIELKNYSQEMKQSIEQILNNYQGVYADY